MRISKFIVTLFFLLTLSTQFVLCQSSFGSGMKVKSKVARTDDNNGPTDNKLARLQKFTGKSNINPAVKPKLYRNIRKLFGSYVGVGDEIKPSEMQYYYVLYRLSEQNMAGCWTKMEALDFTGALTTKHSISTYILNQYDNEESETGREWQTKLKSVCQWSMIYDATGKTVVQERAYDADGNLIFTYSPMIINNNEVVGSYANCWGIPVNMRGKTGSTLVRIKWDDNGNEIEHLFVDEKGRLVRNQDGAFIRKMEYDKAGNLISNYSCDEFGDPMIDNFSNCGWQALYDNSHNQIRVCFIGDDFKPIKNVTNEKSKNSDYQGISIINYEYDKWHREIRESYCDVNGNPATNAFGFHAKAMEYDIHGNLTWLRFYGLDGRICGNSYYYGAGMIHREYDTWGNLSMIEFFGNDTSVRVNGGNDQGWCKWVSHNINREGDNDFYYEYVLKDGAMVCKYSYVRGKNILTQVFPDHIMQIDSFDASGYKVMESYFDPDMNPVEPKGYHKMTSEKQRKEQNVTLMVDRWFDAAGNPVDYKKVAVSMSEVDSLNRTVRYMELNTKGVMLRHFKTFRNENWKIIRQQSLNRFAVPARNLREGGCFSVETKLSFDGGISDVYSRNEFGELTYDHKYNTIYCHRRQMGDSTLYFDENGTSVADGKEFRKSLPIAFVVEVTDSAGYRNGLKDGDVILQYGDWHYDLSKPQDVKAVFWGNIYGAFVGEASRKKVMRVLRHHPALNRSEVVTLNLDSGTIDRLGFNTHYIYYTKAEYRRLQTALNVFVDRNALRSEWNNLNLNSNNLYACVVPECAYSLPTQLLYRLNVPSPFVILAIDRYLADDDLNDAPSTGNQWVTGEDKELMDALIWNKDNRSVAKHRFYITRDGVTIDTISFSFSNMRYTQGGTIANEKISIVNCNNQFAANVKSLMRRLKAGECGFRKSKVYGNVGYISLGEVLYSDAYANMRILTIKHGQDVFDVVLSHSEMRRSVVDSITLLHTDARNMKAARRLSAILDAYDVASEFIDGCIVYKCSKADTLRKVVMIRLDGQNFSMIVHCSMDKSEFNASKLIHALDNYVTASNDNCVSIMRIVEADDVSDKSMHLSGEYVLLEFEDWNMYENYNAFTSSRRMAVGRTVSCLIAPIKRNRNGEVIKVGKPELRPISDFNAWDCSVDNTINWKKVAEIYESWKQNPATKTVSK